MKSKREDFPFIINHPTFTYFDNAATTLKPRQVIDAITYYNEYISANIHRGEYESSIIATDLFEEARQDMATFINAPKDSIVFTSGATESLNMIAYGLRNVLKPGDVILIEESLHASNILPWFELARMSGAKVEYIPLSSLGYVEVETLKAAMHDKVKIVSLGHVSNVLGNITDLKGMAKVIHDYDALLVGDGAQSIAHIPVDVRDLGVDYFVFSAHKMLGPTGVGILYGTQSALDILEPFIVGGGDNIRFNVEGDVEFKSIPYRFESGTPNIEGVLGLKASVNYLTDIGVHNIEERMEELSDYLMEKMHSLDNVIVLNEEGKTGIVSFIVKDIFAHDVALYLSHHHIGVRAGEHCARLLNKALDMPKSVRISMYFYNTFAEIDGLIEVLKEITLEKCVALYI